MQIQRIDLVEQVYVAIKANILEGVLSPETHLRQEDLAEPLGVSRQPISHALALLEREGLITDFGRKGKMVARVDPARLLNLYQVRGVLDGLAASLCAKNVSPELQETLDQIIEDGHKAQRSKSIKALAEADIKFHRTLYTYSGNPEITKTADASWSHLVRSMHQVLENHHLHKGIWEDHQRIAEAIFIGDQQLSQELATHHADSAGQMTFTRLTELKII